MEQKQVEQKKQVFAVMPLKVFEDIMRFMRKLPFEAVEELLPYIKNNTRAVETAEEDNTPASAEVQVPKVETGQEPVGTISTGAQ